MFGNVLSITKFDKHAGIVKSAKKENEIKN